MTSTDKPHDVFLSDNNVDRNVSPGQGGDDYMVQKQEESTVVDEVVNMAVEQVNMEGFIAEEVAPLNVGVIASGPSPPLVRDSTIVFPSNGDGRTNNTHSGKEEAIADNDLISKMLNKPNDSEMDDNDEHCLKSPGKMEVDNATKQFELEEVKQGEFSNSDFLNPVTLDNDDKNTGSADEMNESNKDPNETGAENGNNIEFRSEFKLITTAILIRLALKYTYNTKKEQTKHPVVQELDEMQKRSDVNPGWLRQNEAIAADRPRPDPRSFLTTEEKDLLLKLALILKPIVHQTTSKLAYAWGITRNSVNNIINRACESADLCPNRKRRSDAGETIENCERKRKAVVTAFFIFKKAKRHERNTLIKNGGGQAGEEYKPYGTNELRELWDNAPQEERNYFEQLASEEQAKLRETEM